MLFNGGARATTFVSSTELRVAIPRTDVAIAAIDEITVSNPGPGGGQSSQDFTAEYPPPAITSFSHAIGSAGTGAFTLTVNGTGFVAASTAAFNGVSKTVTPIGPTRLGVAMAAGDIASAGPVHVTVAGRQCSQSLNPFVVK